MIRKCLSSMGFLLAVLILTIGCSQVEVDNQDGNQADVHKPSSIDLEKLTAPERTNVASSQATPSDDAGKERKPAQAGSAADEVIRDLKIGEQELEQTFNQFLRMAKAHKAKGEFEAAERALQRAIEIKPNDGEAQSMMAEIQEMLGRAKGTTHRQIEDAITQERRRVSEGLAEIRMRYQQARKLKDERNYNDCIQLAEEALEIARWFRGRIDISGEERQLKALIKEATVFAERQRQYDLESDMELVNQLKEVERRNKVKRYAEEMRALTEAAKDQFDREQYEECLITLAKILWKDPYNTEAARLREYTRNLMYQKGNRALRSRLLQMWQTAMLNIEESSVPYVGRMWEAELPSLERWREIELRAKAVVRRQTTDTTDPRTRRILDILRQKTVPVGYQERELSEILRIWSETTGLNFNRSREVREDYDYVTATIEDLGHMSLQDALDIVIKRSLNDGVELSYYIENGMIVICTPDEARGKGLISRIFDVKDLLGGYRMFPGEQIRVDRHAGTSPEDEEIEDPIEIDIYDLPDILQDATGGFEVWDGDTTIITEGPNGTLIARNTPEVLAAVDRILNDLRQSRGLMVTIEAKFIEIQDNFLEELGIDYRGGGGVPPGAVGPNLTAAPLDDFQFGLTMASLAGKNYVLGRDNSAGIYWSQAPDFEIRSRIEQMFDQSLGDPDIMTSSGGASFQLSYLDDVQFNAVLRATKKQERVNIVTAPKITCFNTQRANITIRNQVAYIEDFNVEARQNIAIADPQVGTVEDGLVLDMRPVISADRRYVTVEMRPTIALLNRPMDTLTTTLGGAGSTPVTIQLPEVRVQRIRTTVIVPDGGSFILGGLRRKNEIAQKTGIPILSDVPILGTLFERKGRSNIRSEIVIMIKARITDLREMAEYIAPADLGAHGGASDYARFE